MKLELDGLCPLLQVFDMSRSLAFYRDLLGFEVVMTSRPDRDLDWVLLRRGDAHLMLNTAFETDERPPEPDPTRVAAHRDTGLFFACPDVDAAYAYFRAHGVDADPPAVQDYGMRQVYLVDPDGYNLCFQQRV